MLCNVRPSVALPSIASILIATFGLGGCDDQSGAGATSLTKTHGSAEGAHWQKVCSKQYFYRFSDAKTGEDSYCSEWQDKCVDKNGDPAEGCV